MKAIIELNRQQNGITKEDNLIAEANVWTEIKRLTEANKLRKELNDLINKAPTPEGSNFIDIRFNNNKSSILCMKQLNKTIKIIIFFIQFKTKR